jgi:phosphoesterase RecJ-like protein
MDQGLKAKRPTEATIKKAWQLIEEAGTITLLTHYKPDGDGVSACAAFEAFIKAIHPHKPIETIYPSTCDQTIPRSPKVLHVQKHTRIPDLLVQFDCANLERLYMPDEFRAIPLINVDHHISNSINGAVDLVDDKASSACEFLYELMKSWNETAITSYVAECLLYGICYDSQVFHTQSTSAKTLKIAAELVERGANLFEIKTQLLSHQNPAIIALWGELLSNVELSKSGKAAWVSVTLAMLKKHKLSNVALIGLSNFLSQISGVDVIAIFSENEDGTAKVSLRSKQTDVNAIVKLFGGGGHKYAAGFMSSEPFETVVSKVTAQFE